MVKKIADPIMKLRKGRISKCRTSGKGKKKTLSWKEGEEDWKWRKDWIVRSEVECE